jgi:hypothetical protein
MLQRTYTDDVWVPSDPGPEQVSNDPPFGALQFTSDEVESVLQDLDVNKGSATGHFEKLCICFRKTTISSFSQVSYVTPKGTRKVGVTTLRTIPA